MTRLVDVVRRYYECVQQLGRNGGGDESMT